MTGDTMPSPELDRLIDELGVHEVRRLHRVLRTLTPRALERHLARWLARRMLHDRLPRPVVKARLMSFADIERRTAERVIENALRQNRPPIDATPSHDRPHAIIGGST